MTTARYQTIRTETGAIAQIAQHMHATDVHPTQTLDLEPVQRRLLATRHAWACSVYYLHEITNAILDLIAQAEGYADWFARELAVRPVRRRRRRVV